MKYANWLLGLALIPSDGISQLLEWQGPVYAPQVPPSEASTAPDAGVPDAGTPATEAELHKKVQDIHDSIEQLQELLKKVREGAPR
jgi:hypothetical protein